MSTSGEDSAVPGHREGSPSSNPSELGYTSDCSPLDSGLAFDQAFSNHSPAFNAKATPNRYTRSGQRRSAMNTLTSGALAATPNGGASGSMAVPLAELRRPSIVEMVNSGGLVRNPGGSYDINIDNVLPEEVELMYALHGGGGRRDSNEGQGATSSLTSDEEASVQPLAGSTTRCFSSHGGWWKARFNSPILEKYWKKKMVEFLRWRFRIAVMFLGLFVLLWIVFFSVHLPFSPPASTQNPEQSSNNLAIYSVQYSWWYVIGGVVIFATVIALLVLTYWKHYGYVARWLSLALIILLMCASCALAMALRFDSSIEGFTTISYVAQFVLTAVVFLIIFALSHFHIIISLILCSIYLVVLELLINVNTGDHTHDINQKVITYSLIGRILFYVCLLIAGVTTSHLSQLRLHATFWKIAQCVLSHKTLDLERELEEKTILSMMPKPFADELMNIRVQLAFMFKQNIEHEGEHINLPFTMSSVDRVTILFADIVDFTEFSSSLSAAELVGILNEIFSTFDELVTKHQCEKISTLGDCYFCVSGCPEPQVNHAENCVNMGMAIVEALDNFRKRTQQPIEMRIGIHTGSVFCGVMGTRKFKFDVWSKDTTIANRIESVGTPGRVLISQTTKNYLSSAYVVEEANLHNRSSLSTELEGLPLYYVVGRRSRVASVGTSVVEWKRRIQNIDTLHKPAEEQQPSNTATTATVKARPERRFNCPCLPLRRNQSRELHPRRRLQSSQSTSSIVDIFSQQTQLQRCTSYAELPNPQDSQEDVFDRKIVDFMEEQQVSLDSYFDSQLNNITLRFHDNNWESAYRNHGRDLHDGSDEGLTEMELGFQITKLAYLADTVALFLIFLFIMAGSAIQLSSSDTFVSSLLYSWLAVFLIGLVCDVAILVLVTAVFKPEIFPTRFAKFAQIMLNWYVRSIVALFLIYYPMTVVYVSIAQCRDGFDSYAGLAHVQMSFFVTVVVLISSMHFMEVMYLVKLVAGLLFAGFTVVMVVVVHLDLCIRTLPPEVDMAPLPGSGLPPNNTLFHDTIRSYLKNYYTRHIAPEAIIVLLLVWFLLLVVNGMSELSARLSFIARVEAAVRKRFMHQRKAQAEWLLFNIIPQHVAYELRRSGQYSRNHDCVGVIFASIVNFNDFYLIQADGGEESLRILNRVISEFDLLLAKSRFANVEKIKTIGSTYMAASGLSLQTDQPCSAPYLMELVDFAQLMFETLDSVNRQVLGPAFRMRIGFNFGPVTSGVVGSRKMLYDIWGDTVNVASRMDSTGQVGKIHMPEHCHQLLAKFVLVEFDKVINVKGKGAMRTVFVSRDPRSLD